MLDFLTKEKPINLNHIQLIEILKKSKLLLMEVCFKASSLILCISYTYVL